MKKKDIYAAQLSINDDPFNNALRVFVDSPTQFELNRSPKTLTISESTSITQTTIMLEGFDTVERSPNNIDYIQGQVFLCVTKNDIEKKYLLQSPQININGLGFDKKISIIKQLNDFKNHVNSSWQKAFINAQSNPNKDKLEPNEKSEPNATFFQSLRNIKSTHSLNFFKLLAFIIVGLVVLFLSLSVYEKSLKVQAQKVSNNNVDPSSMVSEHDELLNKAFKDMGIDRSKITNDLSCFAE